MTDRESGGRIHPEALQNRIGVRFRHPDTLHTALVHESFVNEYPSETSNERLEFLGDAVLGLVASEMLYERFPTLREGELTRMKSALVNTMSLAGHARDLGLGDAVLLGRGEEASGGRERASLLADAFEALVGAIYVDGGYAVARGFVSLLFSDLLEGLPELNRDYKSLLQQETQKHFKALPIYRVVSEEGPAHCKQFSVEVLFGDEVLGRGTGASKKEAQQIAAQEALANFRAGLRGGSDNDDALQAKGELGAR